MARQPTEPPAFQPGVVVLGGGVAGISAALHLLEAGFPVTLVEARRFLGGRAFSFVDAATGEAVDNGQHVITAGCTRFLDLLQRLGARERWFLQERLNIPVRSRSGVVGALRTGPVPSPFHLLGSLLRYPHLGLRDKLSVLSALVRAKFIRRDEPGLGQTTFRQWLAERRQSQQAVEKFWNVFLEPVLNDNVADVSAAMGLMFVQEAMLKGYHDPDIGYAKGGLLPSLGEPARRRLSALGCRLMLGSPVKKILGGGGSGSNGGGAITGVELGSGEVAAGGCYVSALPWDALLPLLPGDVADADPFFRRIGCIKASPIVNIHLWYDRAVMAEDFSAFVDSPLQWVFNKGSMASVDAPLSRENPGGSGDAHRICVSLSAAWEYIDLPREELAAMAHAEVIRAFPALGDGPGSVSVAVSVDGAPGRSPKLLRWVVVKQRNATIRCLPGVGALRPGSVTPIPNLFLAGDWTDTGWPSTLEGAARSGYNAAQAVAASVAGDG
jgi:squalene-associated FAD-dependent desaturase